MSRTRRIARLLLDVLLAELCPASHNRCPSCHAHLRQGSREGARRAFDAP